MAARERALLGVGSQQGAALVGKALACETLILIYLYYDYHYDIDNVNVVLSISIQEPIRLSDMNMFHFI